MLRVLDLFSGIGGFSLGLERTGGFQTVAFCEIDPFCRRVLAKRFPGVPCSEDITQREFVEGEADVITGGFPCQDISLAGEGAGLAGERSGLWRELARAFRVVRPKHGIVENVAALLSRGMGDVLGDLAAIGYDAEWHCIPASAVGAPHRRDRVWIIADARSQQHQSDRAPYSGTLAAQLLSPDPDANGGRQQECAQFNGEAQQDPADWDSRRRHSDGLGLEVADAESGGRSEGATHAGGCSEGTRTNERPGPAGRGWWFAEPDVGRVADGIPSRVDRLRSLGNAVVPQIPELIGRAIHLQAERAA